MDQTYCRPITICFYTQEIESKCTKKSKLVELRAKHDKERHDHRTYLRTLQYDNEIILCRKMNEFGLLW